MVGGHGIEWRTVAAIDGPVLLLLRVPIAREVRLKIINTGFLAPLFLVLGATTADAAASTAPLSGDLVNALKKNNCVAALKLINPLVTSNDEQTSFIVGRMLAEGLCVKKDTTAAADYFEHAATLGYNPGRLDYASMIGMGVGAAQDYERAGEICRHAGVDSQAQVSLYTLGYACTVRSVASRVMRESIPKNAFKLGADPALVEFAPASAKLTINSTPPVRMGEPPLGSHLGAPLIDANSEINRAWKEAVAQVPKPDATKLDEQAIALSMDLDLTLESGRPDGKKGNLSDLQPLLQNMTH
jgi:hypothetical protein